MNKNPIQMLRKYYSERTAMAARNKIVDGGWENTESLSKDLKTFKRAFRDALEFLRNPDCKRSDKSLFIELLFRAELRILLYQIVKVKNMSKEEAEETCQEILIALFKRLVGNEDDRGCEENYSSKPLYQLQTDDYRSFVYYCFQTIKNYGMEQLETILNMTVDEYDMNRNESIEELS